MDKIKYFVVEDHTLTNRGIREILNENKNYHCCGYAFSRAEASEKISELKENYSLPDLIILDLFLKEESGIELLRQLKNNYPSIKVLIYSMYENPGIVSIVMENKADGFVLKSSPERELLLAVEKILQGETYVQQNLISSLFTYRTIFDGLTKQEQTIFKMLIERKTKQQIASELNIVIRSLENYFSRIYTKTGCKNHEELIKKFG